MIEKIRISGYRKFDNIEIVPHPRFNIIVGDNESGKSTLLEAVSLALTGRINGRPARDELHPYWFNERIVKKFFLDRAERKTVSPPEISIEVFLRDEDEFQRYLYGAHNSDTPTAEHAGLTLWVHPDEEYLEELELHLRKTSSMIPVEYYRVDWRSFGDRTITSRPKDLTVATIDSKTIRSSAGVDLHMRQMLSDHLEPTERVSISLAFRNMKNEMTRNHLGEINTKMADLGGAIEDEPLSLAMDQSSRSSWDSHVVPHVAELPFSMAGQGQQAVTKISLAMSGKVKSAKVVMIEEPENHLSHTTLNKILHRVGSVAADYQQIFVTTHSSFVLNRLGLDNLIFLSSGKPSTISTVSEETVKYFKKLPGYDTLRIVLADRVALVEGPSDEILFERFYKDIYGKPPISDGIDVISMRGLAVNRCLELAKTVGKRCVVLRDNDGAQPSAYVSELEDSGLIDHRKRDIFIGDPTMGSTLEPQIVSHNKDEATLRRILRIPRADINTWMRNNKTEAAIRIAESTSHQLSAPSYFTSAFEFIRESD